ncbi:MAG: hypothetical protein KDB96_07480, partial [Flavobacteriales bacterium]|nr:hypothetical protein [Flavobacteriales bacterium]
VEALKKPTTDDLYKLGIALRDALLMPSPKLNKDLTAAVKASGKPVLDHVGPDEQVAAHVEFFQSVLEEALV